MKKKKLTREQIREMNRDCRSEEIKRYDREGALLEFKWTVSRKRKSFGYRVCSLYVNGIKRASCSGGGYDMKGTTLGHWIANEFRHELVYDPEFIRSAHDNVSNRIKGVNGFFGLSYHDPCYDPGKAEIDGKTVEENENAGKSLGLERYQAFYQDSTKLPDANHFIPMISDGACGFTSVERVLEALGYELKFILETKKNKIYKLRKREGKTDDR